MYSKILFTTSTNSSFNLFTFFFWLVICVIAAFLCTTPYGHAHGASIFILVGVVYLFTTSSGSVTVREDSFVVQNKRLIPGFSDRSDFTFAEVASIEANLSVTPAVGLLRFLLANGHSRVVKNTLSITYKDGRVTNLAPKIYKRELRKALDIIGQHSPIKIEIQGDDI